MTRANNTISDVDLTLFSLHTVKQAAYRLLGEASFVFHQLTENKVRVTFKANNVDECASILDKFHAELLDQDLREQLQKETLTFQNLILAHAFSHLTTMPAIQDSHSVSSHEGSLTSHQSPREHE